MNFVSGLAFFAALSASGANAATPAQTGEAMIRAGHNIAATSCIACHVTSADQTIKPVLGAGIPDFEAIANRPGADAASLQAAMKEARWHDPGMAQTLLPMSRISDRERAQVAAYIMSLRKTP